MFTDLFLELAIALTTAGVLSLLVYKLRQPLILGYILTGVIVGSLLLRYTEPASVLSALSTFGISLLLFIIGLNLNWRRVRDVGGVALFAGLAQIVLTSTIGYFLVRTFGFDLMTSVFLGLGLAFSSATIAVKLLSDKEDLERLYGRIAVGILIVQSVVATFALLFISSWVIEGALSSIVGASLLYSLAGVIVFGLFAQFILPPLFRFVEKSHELMFLIALAWCFLVASVFHLLGFSIELGALLAGMALAGTGFQHEIVSTVRPLRDFFLVLFFVVLGSQLDLSTVSELLAPAIVLSAFVLLAHSLIVFCTMRLTRHHARTAFLTGSTLGQIGEVSFLLLAVGITAKLVAPQALELLTLVALITIAISSYLTAYNEQIYEVMIRAFPFLQPKGSSDDVADDTAPQIILLGYDRMGKRILPMIETLADHFKIMDFNPAVVEELSHYGLPVMYGDAGNEDSLKFARIEKAKMIISTIPDMAVNADIMDYLKRRHSHPAVILTVKSSEDAGRCYALGASYVIVPSILGGEHFAGMLKKQGLGRAKWGELGKKEQQDYAS
ncbi:MAG: cation:proton antiporter [Patescibacteria group bacterium]|jgi:Kef-type K+ transport system membrane component KefB